MTAARALHVDADFHDTGLDRETAIEAARALNPSIIVFSGNGVWPLWLLDAPYSGDGWVERVEAASRELHRKLGADEACHNVDRLMRVPGTINLPNKTKRDRGCVAVLAEVVEANWDKRFSIDHFAAPVERNDENETVEISRGINNVADLPTRIRKILNSGDHEQYGYRSRSEMVYGVVCAMVRKRWDRDAMIEVLLNQTQFRKFTEHVYAQSNPRAYAAKQVDHSVATIEADWITTARGDIVPNSSHNIKKAIALMGYGARLDEFAGRTYMIKDGAPFLLDEHMLNRLWFRIDEENRFKPTIDTFHRFLSDLGWQSKYHPVRDYLNGLRWDGVSRIDDWLFTYGRVPDRDIEINGKTYRDYVRAVGRIMLIAACRRVMQPGCKFDEIMVWVDATQGTGKTETIELLAVKGDWYTGSLDVGAGDKLTIEQTRGKWIVELGELKGKRNADIDRLKSWASNKTDSARLAYDRTRSDVPRQCIFFASTNDVKFLRDRTGNRRYWPIFEPHFDMKALACDLDQLWAEAAHHERLEESIRLSEELWEIAAAVQDVSLEDDPWAEVLHEWLGDKDDAKIRSLDVWDILGIDVRARTPEQEKKMGEAMRSLGWKRAQRRYGGDPEWGYVKGTGARRVVVNRDSDVINQRLFTVVYLDTLPAF